MNNRGQVLLISIIILPVILLILTLIIDLGLVQKEKTKMTSITKTIIKEVYKYDYDLQRIVELYSKNDLKYDSINSSYNDGKLNIIIKKKVKGIFGNLINLNQYNLEINLTGYLENDKLIIEKG